MGTAGQKLTRQPFYLPHASLCQPLPQPQTVYAMAPLYERARKRWPCAQRSAKRLGEEGLKTRFECGGLADGHDSDGSREVPKHYPSPEVRDPLDNARTKCNSCTLVLESHDDSQEVTLGA